jgi:predicted RNase H-like HicB family nuclease
MKYKVQLHRTDEGISVSVPALPGCWSEGDTEAEALENIRDAIREYLAALNDQSVGGELRDHSAAQSDQGVHDGGNCPGCGIDRGRIPKAPVNWQ